MASLTPSYSANRSVREYTDKHYVPAVAAYLARAAESGALGENLARRIREIDARWGTLRFGELNVESGTGEHAFHVQVDLGELDPDHVRVELCADGGDGGEPIRQEMTRVKRRSGSGSA